MEIPTLWDAIGNLIGLTYVFGGVFLAGKLEERTSSNFARKILHLGMGFWIFTWFLFDTRIGVVLTPLIATLALAFASRGIQDRFSEERERHIGLVIYASSITWITLLFWRDHIGTSLWIGAGAFLSLAWGDGMGGVFGEKYGQHTYKFPWAKEKSIEGSLGVGLGTVWALVLAQLCFGRRLLPLMILLGTVTTMIVEALSPKHSDNLFVPLALSLLFVLLEIDA